jgi:large subunit ribosomal protein L32
MAALPKKKTPKSAQGKRRSHVRIAAVATTECPHCHTPRMPHHACPSCGHYKGREAIVLAKPELPE